MWLGTNILDPYIAASLIGFATGTAISVLLLVLTVRAAKLPGTRAANILFAACSLLWNLSGFSHEAAVAWGMPEQARTSLILIALQFSAAAAWPITVFALWSPLVTHRWQRIGCRLLQTLAALSCAAIVIPLWIGAFTATNLRPIIFLKESTAYNGSILLILGVALFRDRLLSRTMRVPSLAMLVGVFGATLADVVQQVLPFDPTLCNGLRVASEQLTLFIVLGAFFLFARFRFSDLFIRNSLRIVLAALSAVAFTLLDHALSLLRFGNHAAFPGAARAFAETLGAVPILLLFTFADRHTAEYVNRWFFRAPDYRALSRQLAEQLAQLRDEPAIGEAVETATRQALDVNGAKLMALESVPKSSWSDAIHDGEPVELDRSDPCLSDRALQDVELLVPARSDGRITHVLAVTPGPARRGLVTHEVNFLRSVAAQFGHRLDTLRREERVIETQSREAVLLQQVTEAELRALRAQINPHFLFNSLNSIANLVVANPEKAEAMTLRLARVFRHVLANSARPLISLREEVEFLETYLQIEEARFGSRLVVQFVIEPEVAKEQIPTLILQPIVENALKHGLGPKTGQGHLWITAEGQGDQMRLRVEDDGVGPAKAGLKHNSNGASKGVGLENVALRLNALYQEQSRVTVEVREAGGTRVTILLPRESGVPAR